MYLHVFNGIMTPFLGTCLGAACVFFMKGESLNRNIQKGLAGFAAGVMMAASIWSLIIPSIELSSGMGKLSFVPAAAGFIIGIIFFMAIEYFIPKSVYMKGGLSKTNMMILAVVIHNIPEGMAVGVVYSGMLYGNGSITLSSAFALSLGIAIQNFPEGAIISMPLRAEGKNRTNAFMQGVMSAVAELAGAISIMIAASLLVPALPYCLGFAAGAMVYVVVAELVPELSSDGLFRAGTAAFAAGFVLMMSLDVALG